MSEDHDTDDELYRRRYLDVMNPPSSSEAGDLVLEGDGQAPPPDGGVDPDELRARVVAALRDVYDPEIPVNIYDLGLVYELSVEPSGQIGIQMTLTAPGCPVADEILHEVHRKVRTTAGVARARTQLVWEPPWTPDRMTDAVKLQLGLL